MAGPAAPDSPDAPDCAPGASEPVPVDEELDAQFLSVMGGVSAPVVVVTAFDTDRPHGTTVSAFASLSRRPPMITVALDCSSALLPIIVATRRLGINVLCAGQSEIALNFARKDDNKFEDVEWHTADGLPRLSGVTGWLACDVESLVDGGDHHLVLGRVRAAVDTPDRPLVYHRREFGTHAAIASDDAPLATTYGEAIVHGEDPYSPVALMGLA